MGRKEIHDFIGTSGSLIAMISNLWRVPTAHIHVKINPKPKTSQGTLRSILRLTSIFPELMPFQLHLPNVAPSAEETYDAVDSSPH